MCRADDAETTRTDLSTQRHRLYAHRQALSTGQADVIPEPE